MYLGDHARARPEAPAVTMWPSGDSITFGELYARSTQLGNLFRASGLAGGDHIAIYSYNHIGYYVVTWAALSAGLYVTPVNAHSTRAEAAYLISNCGAEALIVSDSTLATAEELVADTPGVRLRLTLDASSGSYASIDVLTQDPPSEPTAPERRGHYMFYSSGTTGRPKGIKPPLPDSAAADGDPISAGAQYQFGLGETSVYLSPAPLHHAAPLRTSVVATELGAHVICLERFDPEQALVAIERFRVTASQWVPTMFIRMLKLDPEVRSSYDLSSMTHAVHAAAPCPIWVKEQMIDWWGPIILEYYAGSENIGSTSITSEEWLAHKGSVGRPYGCVIHVCDESGTELAIGADGLIYFDYPATVFEYHGDPEKTAGVRHTTESWRTLGDIGHLDDDGYLYLSDRATFMIISGGANVYPQEIEHVIVEHPGVLDVAVFGIPHPDLGEVPLAVVQPADASVVSDAATADVLAGALRALCVERLARYKVPTRFEFRDTLPRGEDGKLRKKPLRDEYWGEGSKIVR